MQECVVACVEITLKALERTPHHCIPPPQQKLHSSSAFSSAMPSRNPSVVSHGSGSSTVTMNTNRSSASNHVIIIVDHGICRQLDGTRCPLCNVLVNTYCEETITQCMVTLSTALHHMPLLTLPYLAQSINALAKVALPDNFSWDSTKFVLAGIQEHSTYCFSIAG